MYAHADDRVFTIHVMNMLLCQRSQMMWIQGKMLRLLSWGPDVIFGKFVSMFMCVRVCETNFKSQYCEDIFASSDNFKGHFKH